MGLKRSTEKEEFENFKNKISEKYNDCLEEINAEGTTIVMATHDKEIVDAMGKRVIAIEDGHIVRDEASGVYGYEL